MGADPARYLAHIGRAGAQKPTLADLAGILLGHTQSLPFENLDPLLKRPVNLDLPSLEDKLLAQGRGGYCYEHNRLLQAVLGALGFTVTGLAARVLWNAAPGVVRPRTHMLLKVDLPQGPYLVDAGFGAMTPTAPLALTPGLRQPTPHEDFRVMQDAGVLRVEGEVQGQWQPLYSFDLTPQEPADYEPANWYVSTHPGSPFVHVLMAARVTPQGRHTLNGSELAWHPRSGSGERRTLDSADALRQVLTGTFGIRLPQDAGLSAVLAQQVQAGAP
jgi:N-hydroxyarylamine O-acetyltransferase